MVYEYISPNELTPIYPQTLFNQLSQYGLFEPIMFMTVQIEFEGNPQKIESLLVF